MVRGEFAHGVTSRAAICHECLGEGTVVPEPWTLMSAVRHPSVAHGGCLPNRVYNAENTKAETMKTEVVKHESYPESYMN